jgi:hypothetical protein
MVEVVTDNKIDILQFLQLKFDLLDSPARSNFIEIIVPTSYQCPSGAKFKARALHYAILNSTATPKDWIVHLDEETRFNVETVQHCLHHCYTENKQIDDDENLNDDDNNNINDNNNNKNNNTIDNDNKNNINKNNNTINNDNKNNYNNTININIDDNNGNNNNNKNKKIYGNIGQGVILYGTRKKLENYFTTLADSIRVGDDFGKFRLQYECHYPWIGMHGSFVVCQNAVEQLLGFDNGMKGSITEDAFFALVAWQKGVKFSWIDAYMFEQSPFTILDFVYQRRRWFGGLWLVCTDETIQFKYRLVLFVLVTTWKFSALPVLFIGLGNFFAFWNHSTGFATATVWLVSLFSCVTCWSYVLGFVKTFDINDGIVRYFVLLFIQLVMLPLFAVVEVIGVLSAIFFPPYDSFHIVHKESSDLLTEKNE